MKRHGWRFNTYLLAMALAVLPAFAAAPTNSPPSKAVKKPKESKRDKSMVRIHLEAPPDGSERTMEVPVLRSNPIHLSVEKNPFLNEALLVESKVIETPGGVEIELQFDTRGRMLLENYSAANRGKRAAIFCDFGEQRWLAAPVLSRLISNGALRFTPDATRDEADRIVRGLNRVAEVKKKKDK